jgi:hypothetical protein
MRQNLAIFVALFSVLTLGLWGQYQLHPDFSADEFLGLFYQVLTLFVLEGDWTQHIDLPWQLEIARLIAPMVSIAGVLIVLTRDAWVKITNLFIRIWRNHVVVVGLGEKGWKFAQTCRKQVRVVIVEKNPEHPLIERARELGFSVVVGDILNRSVMRAANVKHARHLVTFCGNDGVSVEIALRIRDYRWQLKRDSKKRLRIHLHVDSTRVSSRLESYPKFYDDQKVAEVDFFSVHDLTARLLLRKYPPDAFAETLGQRQVHIALYNFGTLAQHIMTEAVRICHFLNGSKIRFSVIDKNADEKVRALLNLYPGLQELCEIDSVELDYLLPLSLDAVPDEAMQTITEHVICLESDEANLELALMLRSIVLGRKGCSAPINVRMQHASGLAKLLESNEGEPEIPDGIFPFGMLDEVLYFENVLSDGLDELARAIHEDFLSRRIDVVSDHRLYTSLNDWNTLSEPDRKSNRLQADHLAAKLRAVRCRLVKGETRELEFTDDEATALARMEHDRWRANKIFEGWRPGAQRVEGAKINPFTVPWEDLDESERVEQTESIKRLPSLLKTRLGWGIKRELSIGITGHRPHRVDLSDANLLREIDRTLARIRQAEPDKCLILVSSLAEGSDRVVAEMAMTKYDMKVHIPLPLPYELYQTDFQSQSSLNEFKQLVGRSEVYYELPTRFGSQEILAAHIDGSSNGARDQQYALAGAYIALTCDELIAVYDGGEAGGVGGTADVVQWRQRSEIPVILRFDSDFFIRPPMKAPIVIDSPKLDHSSLKQK